jgi:hypothetical protein
MRISVFITLPTFQFYHISQTQDNGFILCSLIISLEKA